MEGRSPCILRRLPPSSAVGQAAPGTRPGASASDAGCWGHVEASSLSAGAPAVLSGVIVTQGFDTAAVDVSCGCRRHGHGRDLGHDTEVMAVSLGHGCGPWAQTPGSWPWAVGLHPGVVCDCGCGHWVCGRDPGCAPWGCLTVDADTGFVAVILGRGHGRGHRGRGRGLWVCTLGSSVTVGADTGAWCGFDPRSRSRSWCGCRVSSSPADQLQVLALSSGAPASGVKTLQTRSPRQGGGRLCAQSAGWPPAALVRGRVPESVFSVTVAPLAPQCLWGRVGRWASGPALKGLGSELSAA